MNVHRILFHLIFIVCISFLFQRLTSVFRTPFDLLWRVFMVFLNLVNIVLLNRLDVDPVAMCEAYNLVIWTLDLSVFFRLLKYM